MNTNTWEAVGIALVLGVALTLVLQSPAGLAVGALLAWGFSPVRATVPVRPHARGKHVRR